MTHTNYDCIIVGAGAAGLMAAAELSKNGDRVCILEAGDKPGGRIATIKSGFSTMAEAGAEFIHSPAPLTLALLKEAGIVCKEVKGKMITVKNGKWQEEEEDNNWGKFMNQLKELQTDMTVNHFLQEYFAGEEYESLRLSVKKFAEGFDLADINNASVLSLMNEWHEEDKDYRINGGYIKLIDYLVKQCKKNGVEILCNQVVKQINYSLDSVTVKTTNTDNLFTASKIIVTVSAGVLQAGDIQFTPELKEHGIALHQLGFGAVIKVLLQFKNPFWNNYNDNLGFIFSNEEIPTWWTQNSSNSNILTGWLGGVQARKKSSTTTENILKLSLLSLSSIFKISATTLYDHLTHYQVECWQNNELVKGGYSYNTIYSSAAKTILSEPVNGVLFFAGEAMYDGASIGTVEAALQSGKIAAQKVKKYQQEVQSASIEH